MECIAFARTNEYDIIREYVKGGALYGSKISESLCSY